ncbi:DUF3888 domain-containing protein [Bacillus sp. 165]|uniref:DUF3888 domain-containing protein n=1 Tax=Bacillus sp. 165 TaxID=1529117 RepID=UPI001AD9A141|nr:DUF3888 domain-containing protein [Bacillus sp. 165]MBO9128348.1 DUF3888 domain-containing protein [Bacillus sp. 165]
MSFILTMAPFAVQAEPSFTMLEDAFYSVLFPKINEAVQQYYGMQKKYDCPTIVSMKKVYSGTYLFAATIEITKYEGKEYEPPKPPFDKVLITFSNKEGEWEVQTIKVVHLPDNTKVNCRKPE